MTVYKKVRVLKDGLLYPLFIDKTKPFEMGKWLHAEYHPTKGFAPRSLGADGNGNTLGGWHCCYKPLAPHLSDVLSTGEKRVWIQCESKGISQKYNRPESQGGAWLLVEWIKPIKILSENEVREITGE